MERSVISQSPYRVLVVDDDPGVQRLIAALLRRGGLSVTVCDNGIDALRTIRETTPDAVVLDLMLPGLSGFEILETLSAAAPELLARIIVVTAVAERSLRTIAPYEPAICRLIRKPFDIAELMAAVNECCTAGKREPEIPQKS